MLYMKLRIVHLCHRGFAGRQLMLGKVQLSAHGVGPMGRPQDCFAVTVKL